MAQTDRGLDQRLIEFLVLRERLHPQRFPDFMGLEKVAAIEQHDPGQVARVVLSGIGFHTYIVWHCPCLESPDWYSMDGRAHSRRIVAASCQLASLELPIATSPQAGSLRLRCERIPG